jgi:hypothetical protein
MAINFDAKSAGASKGWSQASPKTITVAHTCTGSDRILWVAVQVFWDSTIGSITTATYNGTALTKYAENLNGQLYSALYYLIAPATGANNIVVTATVGGGATIDDFFIQGSSYTGVDQTTGVDASATGGSYGTTATASVTTVADNCEVVDSVIHYGSAAITKGANQTLLSSDTSNSAVGSSYLTTPKTPAGSTSMTWTWTGSADWSQCAASFKPAVASTVNSGFFSIL